MKSVLISIQPKWCELIASGKKTVEIRKTKPKLETPFKVYIYCTQDKRLLHKFDKGERIDDEHFFDEHVFVRRDTWIRGYIGNGKVIGEFVCDTFVTDKTFGHDALLRAAACMSDAEAAAYCVNKEMYGWHISDLKIYDKPKELSEFTGLRKTKFGYEPIKITRPPQSWCYVEEV